MARGINKAIIIGNLGSYPEMRYMQSGAAVANVTVATSETWKDKDTGEKNEKTEWHRVIFFGRLAEIVGEYLKKGFQGVRGRSLALGSGNALHNHRQERPGVEAMTSKRKMTAEDATKMFPIGTEVKYFPISDEPDREQRVMKISNFKILRTQKIKGQSVVVASIDVETRFLWMRKTTNRWVYKRASSLLWRFTDTGKVTPDHYVGMLYDAWLVNEPYYIELDGRQVAVPVWASWVQRSCDGVWQFLRAAPNDDLAPKCCRGEVYQIERKD